MHRTQRQQRNTEGIRKFSEQKTREAYLKAEAAIHKLTREQYKVNFNTVALEAGVSKPFLYSQPELRTRIESLREQTEQAVAPFGLLYEELRKENEDMKKELKRLRALLNRSLPRADSIT
ncbi:hypothetical protein B5M42_020780 [Paenibacillus athensensis]|uniref:Rho-GAP domain-containing protein n=1 Tax=Paenibacillus athensensis TaxID=1967502 RepID=A0A4Y8PYN9_9BACL|nr:DUF6262 family protein [Paenibacillus athensensis]MCD1261239.1 hypothetical protein [Paenibacillus athensensis]